MSEPETETVIDTGWDAVLNNSLKEHAPYYAKVLENIENGPGRWRYQKIGVLERSTGAVLSSYHALPRSRETR